MRPYFRLILFPLLAVVAWMAVARPISGRGEGLPASAYVYGVVGHPQTYPLSCESRSAVDWAGYWGVSLSETEFLSGLPRSDNPNAGFVGNPNGLWGGTPPRSYGVHAHPVAELLRLYGLEAEARYDLSWDDLRAEIANGRPAIVWVIGQMWGGNGFDYTAEDGETVRVAAFEHTMILVGYDESWVHVMDAFTGWTQTYSVGAFLQSWGVLGNLAVTGSGRAAEEPAPVSPPTEDNTYTVQRGDYLVALARQFGIDWRELANLNNIPYPFTIYPDQTLRLPENKAEEAPAAQEPAAQEPVAQEPVAQEPAIQEPVAQEPAEQAPAVQEVPPESALPPLPAPPRVPAPTATPAAYAFLILGKPHSYYFPLIAQASSDAAPPEPNDVVAAGVCLFTRGGVLYVKPASFFRGWCIGPALLRPEHLMGLAGSIPELP